MKYRIKIDGYKYIPQKNLLAKWNLNFWWYFFERINDSYRTIFYSSLEEAWEFIDSIRKEEGRKGVMYYYTDEWRE